MSAIDEMIRAQEPAAAGRLRMVLVVAVLVVGLIGGFGLGRAADGGGSTVAPASSAPVSVEGYHGPGHVPRHWVDQP